MLAAVVFGLVGALTALHLTVLVVAGLFYRELRVLRALRAAFSCSSLRETKSW